MSPERPGRAARVAAQCAQGLLRALPTGTGTFMPAELYRRDGSVTSSVVLVSTLISVLTISGYFGLTG